MKSPDEIKKGLECCAMSSYRCEDDCPYREQCRNEQGGKAMNEDALALIQQLEATVSEKEKVVAELSGIIGQLEAERNQIMVAYKEIGGGASNWFSESFRWGTVTHWMPLPEPPKEEPHEENPHTI